MASSSMFVYSPQQIPIFDGELYEYWSSQMETIFISQELWEIISEGYEEFLVKTEEKQSTEAVEEYKEKIKKNATALRIIQQAVGKTVYPRIFGIKKAKDAWNILQKEFQGSEQAISIKLQNLWRRFDNLKMKESEQIRDFYSKVAEIVNQIRSLGDNIEEKKIVQRILRSLTPKFEHIVAILEETKDLSNCSTYELMGSLEAHEQRMIRDTNGQMEEAFQTRVKKFDRKPFQMQMQSRGGNFQRRPQQPKFENNGASRGREHHHQKFNNTAKSCYICKRNGHVANDCWFKCTKCKNQNHSQRDCWNRNKKEEEANITKQDVDFCYTSISDQKESQKTWYLDSGCSNHMTGMKESFVEIDDNFQSQVKLGDGKFLAANGKGVVTICTEEGTKKYINDVMYVPNLKSNLLSVGQLLQKNYMLIFDNNMCEIIDKSDNLLVAAVQMTPNNMFPITMTPKSNFALKTEVDDISFLWHLRYGHLNYKGLKLLKDKRMVIGLPNINKEDEVCEGCVYGKMHRLPFPKTAWRAKASLELVHADICGPIRTPSVSDKRYFLLFVDDYTRMMWVYFLNQKSEAFQKFLQFKAQVERETGNKMKTLRTDRGGEFIYSKFLDYCKDEGIRRQLTTKYTPQQNGVAERKNRTIVEMARSMLKGKNIPNKYWAEAVNTTVYILNRSPTKAVLDRTPYEAWHNRKPVVDHLKVFGCIAYVLISTPNREKFDEKGEKCIFLGYSDESKGYRLVNPTTNKFVISRDVIFDEMTAWNWETETIQETQKFEILEPMKQVEGHDVPSTSAGPSGEGSSSQPSPIRVPHPLPSLREVAETDSDSPPRKTRLLSDVYASCNMVLFTCEPQNFEEAVKEEIWNKAMDDEIHMIEKNRTWELVDLPEDKSVIGLKWVYKTKFNEDGSIQKHKARLVAKGYSQQPGIDFHETYAPVARMETIRIILALAAQMELEVFQLDVKSAFLNGELEEEVYVEQPLGYVQTGNEDKVYRLRKALYGLKQAPRAWNSRIDKYFLQNKFQRSTNEASLYIKTNEQDFLVVCLYVDDLIYASTSKQMVKEFKQVMMQEFEMTDLGLMKYFLGMQVKQSKGEIFLSQEKYTEDMLKKFHMANCKPISTPLCLNEKLQLNDETEKVDTKMYRSLVGSLLYLSHTRPDITFAVSLISRFMNEPSKQHFAAAKRILRYLQGTKKVGIRYVKEIDNTLIGYTDSDWAGSLDDRKSTSGYIFCIGSKIISWSSKKQKTVALSSSEAEYIATTDAACEAIWLKRILDDLKQDTDQSTIIYCDNMSAIAMTKNPVFHARSKHIELRHHFIRDLVNDGEIQMKFINTNDQPADILTKAVSKEKLENFKRFLNIAN